MESIPPLSSVLPQDGAPHTKQNKIKLKIEGKEKKLMKVMKLVIK